MLSAALSVWLVLAVTGFALHIIGLYALFRLKEKKISDYLILQFSFTEAAAIIYQIVFFAIDTFRPELTINGVFETGVTILVVQQFILFFMITFDRVLKVKLSIKYSLVVTKKKLLLACIPCWLISIGHGCVIWYAPSLFNKVFFVWEIFLVIIIITSYVYIFVYFRIIRKKRLGNNTNSVRTVSLNLRVPIMIVTTFIIFYVIPDMLLAAHVVQFSPWFLCIFTMNVISDASIYIMWTPKLRRSILCCSQTSSENNQHSTAPYANTSV